MKFKKELIKYLSLLIILVSSFASAQQSVSGSISDGDGPLPGVTIVEKGTDNGVSSDFDGNYTITTRNQDAVLVFSYIGFLTQEISVGDEAVDFISAVGNFDSQSSAPSCAFDGDDTVYDYPSFQLTTYNNNGVEILTGVYIKDSSVATKEKIEIGSTRADVIKAYGEEYKEEYGVVTYTKGKTDLSFVIMDDVVTSISYIHVVE